MPIARPTVIAAVLAAGLIGLHAQSSSQERTLVEFDFTASAQGWVVSGDTGSVEPVFHPSGGNAGGHISNADEALGETWYFRAPEGLLKHLAAAENGTLSYSLKQSTDDQGFLDDDVIIVGPAGRLLDRALEEAGVDRRKVYVTNAVKHFKFVPRGKIRLHQKPTTPEIKACRQWYERELATIKPALVVAMGATAAQCVLGKITPINKNRGHLIDLEEGARALVTVHPSYLLRLPDAQAKAREYDRFVDDLKMAAALLAKADAH